MQNSVYKQPSQLLQFRIRDSPRCRGFTEQQIASRLKIGIILRDDFQLNVI
jgi:hypothetical protein